MKTYITLLVAILFISCSKDDNNVTIQTEEDIIQYLEDNNLNAQRSTSGLYFIIENEGNGERPSYTSNVTVSYKGYFLNGSVFDQSSSQGITFNLQNVISGWTEGITYFKEGGEGMLLIPPHLGYGNYDRSGIPGGSVLLFDIKLIDVN